MSPRFRPPARPPGPLAAATVAATLAATLALAGCGSGSNDAFAPACPERAILRDAADLARYRGSGRDITDLVLAGRITGLQGSCKRDGTRVVDTTVSVGLTLARGPAATGRTADVAYFVAVTDGERVLDRRTFPIHAEFPPNTDRLSLAGDEVDLRLPVTATKSAAAYKVWIGVVLTPLEAQASQPRR